MARKPKTYVGTFRKLLLLALVLTVVAVAGLFWFGRAGQEPRRPVEDEETQRTRRGTTLIGEDFDYTFTEREKPIFRIRGASVRADEKGVVYLNDVGVTIYDQQGRPYHVESRKALFKRETNEGLLQGKVFLRGPENLELRTARLDLKRKGQLLVAPRAPVEIRYGARYVVTSNRLEVDLPRDEYLLQGTVRVRTMPGAPGKPASLNAQRLVYERPQRFLRVEGNSELRHGPDWLKARRLTAKLTPDESGLHFVRAFWGVTGQTSAAIEDPARGEQPTIVRFSGKDLAAVLRPEGDEIRRMDLDAPNKGKAVIESTGGGLTRTMRAARFEGLLAQGVLTSAQAFGGVEIREVNRSRRESGTREAEGKRAEAAFRPDGQLASVELIGDVLYRDPQVTADGNRGSLDMEAGRGEFMGNPVTITSERGRVRAPRVVYNTDNEIVQARGGVRATLEQVSETALAGSPLGEGEGPVMVESQEAFWKQEPSSFIFRGDVRAWRGENLLLAPELRGDKAQQTLVATGGVKTRWIPDSDIEPGQDPEPAATKPKAGSPQASRAPIEVAASEMTYREGSGELTYTGNVRVNQETRTLTCQNLQVELEEAQGKEDEREVETMTCTGDARLNDPQTGRKAEGQTAVYQVARRRVEMTGDPVTLLDRDGNVLRGRRLFYYMDDGRVEMKGGREQAPTPAAGGGSR